MDLATPSNEFEEGILKNITDHGYQLNVVGDSESGEPVFVYTIGLWETFGHPELITIGLHYKMASQIFKQVFEELKSGKPHLKAGEIRSDFIDGFLCKLLSASPELFKEYLLSAIWRYKGTDFPVLQIVFQNADRFWPWDHEASEQFVRDQPLLGPVVSSS